MPFGQLIIGPPGSGKTTYCHGMSQFLNSIGRKVAVVNLDPANDRLPYEATIDISDLVCLEDVMTQLDLGPNGGLVYAMEYLEQNIDWLVSKLSSYKDHYILFDCPGQVELYTHQNSVKSVVNKLMKLMDFRFVAMHLVDAHYCADPSKFISAVLLSLTTMVQLELPAINVLSKIDLVEAYGQLAFNLDFYTDIPDLSQILPFLQAPPTTATPGTSSSEEEGEGEGGGGGAGGAVVDGQGEGAWRSSRFFRRHAKLHEMLCELVQDFSLVAFTTLNIEDADSVRRVLRLADKCVGFSMAAINSSSADDAAGASGVPPEFRATMGEEDWGFEANARAKEQYTGMYSD